MNEHNESFHIHKSFVHTTFINGEKPKSGSKKIAKFLKTQKGAKKIKIK